MKELTRAEEQVMQILWELQTGFVKDIVEKFDDPKPATTTISTIVRILETKGFVGHKAYGKTHEYFPLVAKDEYKKIFMGNFMKNYFSNSYKQLVSFFSNDNKMSLDEMEEMVKILQDEMKKKKSNM